MHRFKNYKELGHRLHPLTEGTSIVRYFTRSSEALSHSASFYTITDTNKQTIHSTTGSFLLWLSLKSLTNKKERHVHIKSSVIAQKNFFFEIQFYKAASMVSQTARSLAGQVCMRGWPATWAVHGVVGGATWMLLHGCMYNVPVVFF